MGQETTVLSVIGSRCCASLLLVWVGCSEGMEPEDFAEPDARTSASEGPEVQAVSEVPPARRSAVLGLGWETSTDVAWTSSGDASGFHLLVADENQAYAWRTVATLSEPGIETDQWIGNVCLTASGRHAVVAYAPRAFTNEIELAQRGAYTAVVNMDSGKVTKLGVRSSLAYFSPGCGNGEIAVVTQERMDDADHLAATRLFVVNAVQGDIAPPIEMRGQLTSAVPVGDAVVATDGRHLVQVERSGKTQVLAVTHGVASRLLPDPEGGVVFLDHAGDEARVRRLTGMGTDGKVVDLVEGRTGEIGVIPGPGGSIFITGGGVAIGALPKQVRLLPVAVGSRISSLGHLAILPPGSVVHTALGDPVRQVWLRTKMMTTGERIDFAVTPGARPTRRIGEGIKPHPLLGDRTGTTPGPGVPERASRITMDASARAAGVSATPVDEAATCAVPRNDVRSQVYQPTQRQVEWAADQAVQGNLMMTRPANWKHSGMPSYIPQALFPLKSLDGGGRVPVQILLGIMAQESNQWQASSHAVPGETGNPLIGNFYGRDTFISDEERGDGKTEWDIDFSDADCGYGITQVTDGMRKAGHARILPDGSTETLLSPDKQRAVALDYATNIAAGLNILIDKWNETRKAGIIHSDGDPRNIENWFFAIWAYNSGLHPDKGDGSPWGLGWFNNPINPRYPAERHFFNADPGDAAHPQDWPYPEKVLGFAAFGQASAYEGSFRAAWWRTESNRWNAKPFLGAFCDERNVCDIFDYVRPNAEEVESEPPGPCHHKNAAGEYDLKCWWHWPQTFNDCENGKCGYEFMRFDTGYPEQPDGIMYAPKCDLSDLPDGALVVDNVASGIPSVRPECDAAVPNHGTFSLRFGAGDRDGDGEYPSKVDFHQVGTGYGGHNWFTHTQPDDAMGRRRQVTGTWTLGRSLNGWARVMVHLPGHHAATQRARYRIDLGDGTIKTRYASQLAAGARGMNTWVSLGVMAFSGTPSITLDNISAEPISKAELEFRDPPLNRNPSIAWDAVAFVPLPAKPKHFVVALGDSYSSGEGVTYEKSEELQGNDYTPETDFNNRAGLINLCHRSEQAWSRQGVLKDSGTSIGFRSDDSDPTLDYQFLACSGAVANNLVPGGYGQWFEVAQMDQGYLDENTTLVTVSVGGNDAGFGAIIKKCLKTSDCQEKTIEICDLNDDCDETGADHTSGVMSEIVSEHIAGTVRVRVTHTLLKIHERAANARIVLMGYPKAFPDRTTEEIDEIYDNSILRDPGVCSGNIDPTNPVDVLFSPREGRFANTVSENLNTVFAAVAEELREEEDIDVYFSDPTDDFRGHDICSADPAVHGLVFGDVPLVDDISGKTESELIFLIEEGALQVSQQSFHPNLLGAQRYAIALNKTLRKMGM